ncbi:hypothetical protein LTR17_009366 [Elasticomyces elasticus]|nr:hypothetical protein LTR17_009366 [Elasticomyces elasticus]
MARLPKPSSSDLKILPAFAGRTPHWPTAQKNAFCKSTGAIAQPGKVISKHERRARREASISNLDGLEDDKPEEKPEDDHGSFAWLGRKMRAEADRQANQYLTKLDQDIEQNWAPEACINNVQGLRGGRHPYSARSCIVLLMAFLIVFGTAHTMITYLLSAFRVSAACTPTTVFIPVTYTSTVTYTPPASDASAIGSSNPATRSTIHSTIYSTQTMTNTVTVLSSADSPTSYAATVTTTQLVSPVSTLPIVTSLSTYTLPAYTSTTFSFVGPPVTLTSTSTMYSTVQVSYAPSSSSSRTGMGPAGWNSTSSAIAGPATPSISGTAVVETLTATYYYGTGDATTSTATTLLTTTITVHGTSTATLYSTSFDLTSTSTSSTSISIKLDLQHEWHFVKLTLGIYTDLNLKCSGVCRILVFTGCISTSLLELNLDECDQHASERIAIVVRDSCEQQPVRQFFSRQRTQQLVLGDEQLNRQHDTGKLDYCCRDHTYHQHSPVWTGDDYARDYKHDNRLDGHRHLHRVRLLRLERHHDDPISCQPSDRIVFGQHHHCTRSCAGQSSDRKLVISVDKLPDATVWEHDLRTILERSSVNRHRTFNNSPGQWINGGIVNAVQRLVWSYGVFDSTRFRISDDKLSHVSEHIVFERTPAINESVYRKRIEQLLQRCVCLKLDAHHNGVKLGGHSVFALIVIRCECWTCHLLLRQQLKPTYDFNGQLELELPPKLLFSAERLKHSNVRKLVESLPSVLGHSYANRLR